MVGLAQLMVVLDATIVNIALPSVQADLCSSPPARWRGQVGGHGNGRRRTRA
ncbi:hypothetical protein HFP71_37630 [Streptomyces sp. ARC32]